MAVKNFAPPPAFAPAEYDLADIHALRALERGDATEVQQKRALSWVVHNAALTHDLDYRPDSRDHAFASGRRFVGLQVLKLLTIDVSLLKKDSDDA